jgi:chemotaxis protein MotB
MKVHVLVSLLVLGSVGCVPKNRYDQVVENARLLQSDVGMMQGYGNQKLAEQDAKVAALQSEISAAHDKLTSSESSLAEGNLKGEQLQKQLDESALINEQLRKELKHLGTNVDKLLSEKGLLSKSLKDTQVQLEQLRKAQEAASKRQALFRELAARFQRMIDAGELRILLRDGRMVLRLSNDVLFDSGKTELKVEGKQAVKKVAKGLASMKERQFQVAGHTDNVPIQTSQFRSNWELSTARAVAVVRVLLEEGVQPTMLSAAGYADVDPVASNDSREGKAKNRRIEITLQPNMEELVNAKTPSK